MMVSTRERYALRVMLDMAKHGNGEWQRLRDIARHQQLSKKYLESIMAALIRAGLVESALGKSGGYRLTRSPEDYSMGKSCGQRREISPRSPVRRRERRPADDPAAATRVFSGKGWRSRSTPISTAIPWHNSCENMTGRFCGTGEKNKVVPLCTKNF